MDPLFLLSAAELTPETLLPAASAAWGISIFLLTARLLLICDSAHSADQAAWDFEGRRLGKIRNHSGCFSRAEPLIQELAESRVVQFFPLPAIRSALNRGAAQVPWKAEEYAATTLFEGLLLFLAISTGAWAAGFVGAGPLVALVFTATYVHGAVRSVVSEGEERVSAIAHRMPFNVDLIALTMQAGAGFRESLATIVRENPTHPFSEEFTRVLNDLDHGRTLPDALEDLNDRMDSPEIREVVRSVCRSAELGTPLAEIFVNLADQLREKVTQQAEATAGKAKIRLHGPQLAIMIACMATIVAVFVGESVMEL